jgi:DNA-directed RNA polymerase subunit M
MLFCPKCGSILRPGKHKGELECCGCKFKVTPKEQTKVVTEVNKPSRRIEVIEREPEMLPKTKEECPKCKHNEAFYWLKQTRGADEAETKFLKCVKCGHTWRDYS